MSTEIWVYIAASVLTLGGLLWLLPALARSTARKPEARLSPARPRQPPSDSAAESSAAESSAAESLPDLLASAICEAQDAESTFASAPQIEIDDPADEDAEVHLYFEADAEEDEPTAPAARIMLIANGDTDRGRERSRNEDSFLSLPERGLFVVADGMGGYEGGQIASSLAVEAFRNAFEHVTDLIYDDALPRRGGELASAVQVANRAVFDAARTRAELAAMGTTFVALRISLHKQRLYVGHVGDSRCYRLRGSELRQLTTDHVLGQLGVQGPMAGHLLRAVGVKSQVSVDLLVDKPLPGDIYLLCSDGLPKMLSDAAIRDTLMADSDPEVAVYNLIEQANDAGGKDNVTVVLAKIVPQAGVTAAHATGGTHA